MDDWINFQDLVNSVIFLVDEGVNFQNVLLFLSFFFFFLKLVKHEFKGTTTEGRAFS